MFVNCFIQHAISHFVHVDLFASISFVSLNKLYQYTSFVCPCLIWRTLVCLHILTAVNYTLRSIHKQAFCGHISSILSSIYLWVRVWEHIVILWLTYLQTIPQFYTVASSFWIPTNNVLEVLISLYPHKYLLLCF